MKYKFFVFSDVHGEYDALIKSLTEAGFVESNPNHILVCVGDLFDRGDKNKELFRLMSHGSNSKKYIWIKGNHEEMLEEALEKNLDGEFVLFNMLHNGLDKTISSFANKKLEGTTTINEIEMAIERAKVFSSGGISLKSKIKSLPYYFETKNYIFVHAGLDPELRNWKETPKDFMTWDIECSHLPIYSTDKIVIIGHHHAKRVRQIGIESHIGENSLGILYVGNTDENRPVRFGNKIAIDPCSNLTKKINVLVIEDEMLEDKTEEKANETKVDNEETITYYSYGSDTIRINTDYTTMFGGFRF